MDILNKPLGWIINICYELTNNYAMALVIFAVVMQLILLPFGIKQQKNSVKQAALRPKEMAIRKKYAGRVDKLTQQKMQNEIMELYQKENFNPMGGCLPLLIQMPILFALFNVVTEPLKYICGFTSDTIKAIQLKVSELLDPSVGEKIIESFKKGSASNIETISRMRELGVENFLNNEGEIITEEVLPNFHMFGNAFDLSGVPNVEDIGTKAGWLLIIPVLTLIFTYGSQWVTRKFTYQPNADAANNGSMKMMMLTMPLVSVYFTFIVPAAVGFYWVIRNILSTVQQIVLAKAMPLPKFTEEDYKAAEKEMNGKQKKGKGNKSTSTSKPRSLHRIDEYEDEVVETTAEEKSEEKSEESDEHELKEGVDKEEAPKLKD